MNLRDFERRVDELIDLAGRVLDSTTESRLGSYASGELFAEFRSAGLSFLKNTYGSEHPHYQEFFKRTNEAYPSEIKVGRGILVAVKKEIVGGWAQTTQGIVSAEIFADFVEMSTHLLEEGYKDADAVMIGSVLEEQLRQLCRKHSIDVEIITSNGNAPKKAEAMNADLAKQSVYNKLDQKNFTAWLDLRNKAAHGKYSEYTKEQVSIMLLGASDFMARVSV